MKYYFAYGSDLNVEVFEKKCPSLISIASAKLDDYEFFVDKSGKTNIKQSLGENLYGGIWKISDHDFTKLENETDLRLTSVPVKIERYFCDEIIPKDAKIFTSIKDSQSLGICFDASLQDLFLGGLYFELPESYLEFTQRFYAKHIFIYSKILMGYDNDYITGKLEVKKLGVAQTYFKYKRKRYKQETLLYNINDYKQSTEGIIYQFDDMKALDFFDGIFANRKFFRRYPIRVKTAQGQNILAWCYFKEESLNLGIVQPSQTK